MVVAIRALAEERAELRAAAREATRAARDLEAEVRDLVSRAALRSLGAAEVVRKARGAARRMRAAGAQRSLAAARARTDALVAEVRRGGEAVNVRESAPPGGRRRGLGDDAAGPGQCQAGQQSLGRGPLDSWWVGVDPGADRGLGADDDFIAQAGPVTLSLREALVRGTLGTARAAA